MMLQHIIVVSLFAVTLVSSSEWSYGGDNGPSTWRYDCQKDAQSPINIKTRKLKFKAALTEPNLLSGYDSSLSGSLVNNGHSVSLSLPNGIEMSLPTVAGKYRAVNVHFHWGTDDTKGSEHLVNSKAYPMEMHIVHVNTKYSSVSEALGHSDGLAVLGFFFEEDDDDNDAFSPITDNLESIAEEGNIKQISGVVLEDLMHSDLGSYYRYKGSLTTPPCSEVVTWTVFSEPIEIGADQMELFRTKIHLEEHNENNFRPVQPLNGRRVYTGDKDLKGSSSEDDDSSCD